MTNSLKNKTALITGATNGLGLAIAIEMASKGAHIIALGRTVGALEDLDDKISKAGSTATLVPIDLLEPEQLDALGPSLFPKFPSLDFFIGNAAYLGALSPVSHFKTEEWSKIIGTNLSANWHLIRTLDPLLRRAENSTALFISDEERVENSPAYCGPYAASKAALEVLVKSYANEINGTPLKVQIFNPGPMATNLRRKAFPGEDQSTLSTPQEVATYIVDFLVENNYPNSAEISYV